MLPGQTSQSVYLRVDPLSLVEMDVQELCEVFENAKPDDADHDKRVMDLMQKMQSYGPPPKEIMSGLLPGVQFDQDGMPKLPDMGGQPGSAEQCSIS